ncbi:hypothetical protein GDO78_013698 [Eleutherodactylus coqui]|uniref:Uncharacterized protein n=1 Tax=Eleutherodactylus coqui TaxID=57060 RepID=A0A8J6BLV9_ELECQ|nr:hypothetical protein GDO78_013698 [Eleutherodactylus coqui]
MEEKLQMPRTLLTKSRGSSHGAICVISRLGYDSGVHFYPSPINIRVYAKNTKKSDHSHFYCTSLDKKAMVSNAELSGSTIPHSAASRGGPLIPGSSVLPENPLAKIDNLVTERQRLRSPGPSHKHFCGNVNSCNIVGASVFLDGVLMSGPNTETATETQHGHGLTCPASFSFSWPVPGTEPSALTKQSPSAWRRPRGSQRTPRCLDAYTEFGELLRSGKCAQKAVLVLQDAVPFR